MGYVVKLTKNVLKEDIPKIKKSGINMDALYKSLKRLETNPYGNSKAKTGDLQGVRGVCWKNGYRILFKIDDEISQVIVIAIDNHDNAYRKAKKRS